MPSDEPSRPYNWRPKSLAKLKLFTRINKVLLFLLWYLETEEEKYAQNQGNANIEPCVD